MGELTATKTSLDFLWINLVNVLILGCASGQVLLPEHLHRHGLTQWEIGMIWAGFACSAILIRMQLGLWLVRFGQLPFLRAGATVIVLCQWTYSWLEPSAPVVCGLRCLEGLALASYFTAAWSRVIDGAPAGQVGRVSGLFGISGIVAGAVGPWALEHVATIWDYHTAFLCASVAGLLGLLGLFRFRRELGGTPRDAEAPPFWRIALSAPMRSTVLSAWLFGMNLGVFNTFIVIYAFRLGLAPVGPMFLLYTLTSVSTRLRLGPLSDEVHPKRIIIPALALLCLSNGMLAALPWNPLYALLLLGGACAGAAHGIAYPAISNLALQRAGASSNGASAVFTACMDFGNLVGCGAAGWIAHAYGHATAFGVVGLAMGLGVLSVAALERASPPGAEV